MKLGEALKIRSDNTSRIAELTQLASENAQIQEGSTPPADPAELIPEIERLTIETTALIQRINRTNAMTRLADGTYISDALAERDRLLLLRTSFRAIARASSESQARYMRSEIRVVRTVDTAMLLKRSDDLAKRHRLLDTLIQEANWTIDLME